MKRLLSWMLAIAIVMSVIPMIPVPGSAESLYIRKVVSVVYDDSGSMSGDKAAYANYAMQAFCGMLNSEDQLFITYMRNANNDPNHDPAKVDLSAGGIQGSVDAIRGHSVGGSTPYSAVEIAYKKLKSVSDPNPNTQYWLVVITDGAFDECSKMSDSQRVAFLNEKFKTYTESTMPNGTNPQVTFLGIEDVASPDANPGKGIYTYNASNAADIINAMSSMADRISGRTRLQKSDIKQIDEKTIQVSSSIPLLNIAAFVQGSQAKLTGASTDEGKSVPITRTVSLRHSGVSGLAGGAYLLGDSQAVIGAGTYTLTFDQKVNLENLIILFEPALEMRMTLTLNGKKVTNNSELNNAMEGDKISVSCKIYEMGTDKEIDPTLMPSGTKFAITVSENGQVMQQSTGKDMLLQDYVLKNTDTEITGAVMIEGFNPIDFSVKFTPTKYIPRIVYSVVPSFGSSVKSVKFDHIANNKDLTVCFTVLADGVAMTDPEAVKALNPVISLSPQGNDGTVTYSQDGKIVFTPNTASVTTSNNGSFDVTVTCTLEDGTSASEVYTVLLATYQVIAVNATDPVKKTGLFGNQTSVSFYITKDGVKLDKAAVEQQISILLNEEYESLKKDVVVAPDGTITVTPHSEEPHKMNWLTNWWYYWGLPKDDIVVTLSHAYGVGDATIEIIDEDGSYLFWNVWVPFLLEAIVVILLVTWAILVVTKPRYLKSATLYVGDIKYNSDNGTHILRNFSPVKLDKFNKIKRGNGRLKFKKAADVVSANGIKIQADYHGRIICQMSRATAWYKGRVQPYDTDLENLKTPAAISEAVEKRKKLEINEFATTETVEGEHERGLTPANPQKPKYIVIPEDGNGITVIDGKRVIKAGKIFIYIN